MKRTNLEKGNKICTWRGKSLKEMDDQEYITTLEKVIDHLEKEIKMRKGDFDFLTELAAFKPGRE